MKCRSLLAVLALTAIALSGCSSGERGSSAASTNGRLLTAAAFAEVVETSERFVLNVHTPDEGSIPGTDNSIPYDELRARASELPPTDTLLALYCRSGRMSAVAFDTLSKLGYKDIVELAGGMVAWEESGRALLPAGSAGSAG